jgi:hypothetical protein
MAMHSNGIYITFLTELPESVLLLNLIIMILSIPISVSISISIMSHLPTAHFAQDEHNTPCTFIAKDLYHARRHQLSSKHIDKKLEASAIKTKTESAGIFHY